MANRTHRAALRPWRLPLLALALVAAVLAAGIDTAKAQGGGRDYGDVGLVLEVPDHRSVTSRDLDIIVMNHGSMTAYDVEVLVNIAIPENSSFFNQVPSVPVGSASLGDDGYSLRWAIPALEGLQREKVTARVITKSTTPPTFDKLNYIHGYYGEITTSSFESDLHRRNNRHRVWPQTDNPHNGDSEQAWANYSVKVSVEVEPIIRTGSGRS